MLVLLLLGSTLCCLKRKVGTVSKKKQFVCSCFFFQGRLFWTREEKRPGLAFRGLSVLFFESLCLETEKKRPTFFFCNKIKIFWVNSFELTLPNRNRQRKPLFSWKVKKLFFFYFSSVFFVKRETYLFLFFQQFSLLFFVQTPVHCVSSKTNSGKSALVLLNKKKEKFFWLGF